MQRNINKRLKNPAGLFPRKFTVFSAVLLSAFFVVVSSGESRAWDREAERASINLAEDLETFFTNYITGIDTIFVAPFEFDQTRGLNGLDELLRDSLVYALNSYTSLNVVERERMEAIFEEQAFTKSGLVKTDYSRKATKLYGAQGYLAGDLVVFPDTVVWLLRLVDIETGEIFWAGEEELGVKHVMGPHDSDNDHMLWLMGLFDAAGKCAAEMADYIMDNDPDALLLVPVLENSSSRHYFGFDREVTAKVVNELAARNVRVVERANLETLMEEMKLSKVLNAKNAVKFGQMLGANYMLGGSLTVTQAGDMYTVFGDRKEVRIDSFVKLRLVDIDSSRVEYSADEESSIFY